MYNEAFAEVLARHDFAALSESQLGVYPQMIGPAALVAHEAAITVSDEAREYVLSWLSEAYGVTMQ